jgi:hypothetical protein
MKQSKQNQAVSQKTTSKFKKGDKVIYRHGGATIHTEVVHLRRDGHIVVKKGYGGVQAWATPEALELDVPVEKKTVSKSSSLPSNVDSDIREFLEENRPHDDADFVMENSTVEELFDMYLTWNGVIGYTSQFIAALDGIRAYVEAPTPQNPHVPGTLAYKLHGVTDRDERLRIGQAHGVACREERAADEQKIGQASWLGYLKNNANLIPAVHHFCGGSVWGYVNAADYKKMKTVEFLPLTGERKRYSVKEITISNNMSVNEWNGFQRELNNAEMAVR